MSPRREPLLWLQCLALGAIPLELLLIRLLLAGADPGPIPAIERLLLWGVGAVAPAVALWKRPADWGSLLVVRRPTSRRSADQQALSYGQNGRLSGASVLVAGLLLLPLIWWLDDSAVLVGEFSPVSDQSRLVTLLLSTPVLAVILWQSQQLIQAGFWLITNEANSDSEGDLFAEAQLQEERTSLGLQLLELAPLNWPEPPESPAPTPPAVEVAEKEKVGEAAKQPDPVDEISSIEADSAKSDSQQAEAESDELVSEHSTDKDLNDKDVAQSDSVAAAVAVEPDQAGEEDESSRLDSEITEVDAVASGDAESHGEQPKPGGRAEGEPESPSEAPPGSQ